MGSRLRAQYLRGIQGIYWGCLGIMEHKMEAIGIIGIIIPFSSQPSSQDAIRRAEHLQPKNLKGPTDRPYLHPLEGWSLEFSANRFPDLGAVLRCPKIVASSLAHQPQDFYLHPTTPTSPEYDRMIPILEPPTQIQKPLSQTLQPQMLDPKSLNPKHFSQTPIIKTQPLCPKCPNP